MQRLLLPRNLVLLFCGALALFTAWMPVYRGTLRLEIKYNEGWNAYNAATVAEHSLLYPVRYGWTMANYPSFSFVAIAGLARYTHEYLFTGRALSLCSLLLSCVLAGAIVTRLTASRRHGLLTAMLCLALFCANADTYVAMNEPQMFAQLFFMAALLVYLRGPERPASLVLCALLIVLGGNVKHNLIDFPLAIAIDLALRSRRRLLLFVGAALLFELAAFQLNLYVGGPHFLGQLLVPRLYTLVRLVNSVWDYYMPLLIPVVAAIAAALRAARSPERRVLALLLAASLAVGIFFAGGDGVSINTFFSSTLAIAMLLGLFLHPAGAPAGGWAALARRRELIAPAALFAWMLVPMACNEILFPREQLAQLQTAQQYYSEEVQLLRSQPGPALCESILRCYDAGKPYVLDPFNATSLIKFGKLDQNVLVQGIQDRRYAAVQFDKRPNADGLPKAPDERFTRAVLEAVRDNYRPVLVHADCTIYLPAKPRELALKLPGARPHR
jgi:hypothetical protein